MAREELRKTRDTVVQFVREYRNKPEGENNVDWLTRQFGRYPDLWSTSADCRRDAGEIVDAVEKFQKDRQELEEHLESGNSVEKYIHYMEDISKQM